jgi:hypothetical protein
VLDGLTGAAAFVHDARLDNLAANQFGYALYSDMFSRAAGPGPVNSEPGSKSAEALRFLGSWATTPQQPERRDAPDRP